VNHRITRLYPLAISLGLILGVALTYLLLTRVFSLAPLEALAAEEAFQSQIVKQSLSPDGRWTAFLTRSRAIDNSGNYQLHIQPAGTPAHRRHLATSRTFDPVDSATLIWSPDSKKLSAHLGPEHLSHTLD
jgi:hypothetical protein